ncbi:TonB-dependent receptor [Fibrisoma montanum]|uniref:TonB-dependent receptor n=1 Tax=Fibrisoma montanum TaxID=2305895 RepID=A0A418LWT3_9BACT|nr:TonB-dependent receptor [Fibrisoma montanum]
MLFRVLPTAILTIALCTAFGQGNQSPTGVIVGTVRDKNTQEPLVGVTIQPEGSTTVGTLTDIEGRFRLTLPVGSVNLKASFVGYQPLVKYNIIVTSGNASEQVFELAEENKNLSEVVVRANRAVAAVTTIETPNSIQRLSTDEIKTNPGGNFDVSRVIQTLPGVGGSVGGLRNDIVIRGGAPNENVFFLDGIEIPVINHFQTQGGTGGPQGILNVSFLEDVTLSSSSFDARYDNALASVFQFKQREGNPDRLQSNIRLSATELAGTLEGPLAPKTTFLASVRRSYLQFFFQLIDLPIRPDYWDFQYKITHKLTPKTTLTTLGIGAIDRFRFAVPREITPEKEYTIRQNPLIRQWNYTVGVSLRQLIERGYINLALSRNTFDNSLDRFEDAREDDPTAQTLRLRSNETETKLRADISQRINGWQLSAGGVVQYVQFANNIAARIRNEVRNTDGSILSPAVQIISLSDIGFTRFGGFIQANRSFIGSRLGVSAGLRTDMNTFTSNGLDPLRTLSPRLALSYALTDRWNINASVGRYTKIPIYTVLGFRNEAGELVNKTNEYIKSNHYVAGLEYVPSPTTRFTVEGFYKRYSDYPVSIRDGISLANQGTDFTALGNEAVSSTGRGRTYGVELFFQQKLVKNIFAVASLTFVRSLFSGQDGELIPSAWDNRLLFSGLLGRKFPRGWEMGLKYRFAGGAPFTPFDLEQSQRNYLALGNGVLADDQLNTGRLKALNQFDFRLDKKWNFRRTTIDVFLDVQNAFVLPTPAYPEFVLARKPGNGGFQTTDGATIRPDGSNGIPTVLTNNDPFVTPTLGFIVEF